MTLEWVIVGGGLQGVHLAARLLDDGGVGLDQLAVVDPGERLLEQWRARVAVTGMRFLRSPSMHHLDSAPYSLQAFAAQQRGHRRAMFTTPNNRPSVALFHAHCDHVVERLGLQAQHVRDRVEGIALDEGSAWVELAGGRGIAARRVILALGSGEALAWPAWAPRGHRRVRHVFQPEVEDRRPAGTVVGVIGGGVTAAQVALRLAREGRRVVMVTRHALRTSQYDSEPGWHGPKFMTAFARLEDPRARRAEVASGRNRGSMPPDVRHALDGALRRGAIELHRASVTSADVSGPGVRLTLEDGARLELDELLLATGFSGERPGGALVDRLVEEEGLPCAPCGFPIVDPALRWHRRIHVAGPLAELELGPVAGNISGARRAGERIVRGALANPGLGRPAFGAARPGGRVGTGGPRLVPWGNRRRLS